MRLGPLKILQLPGTATGGVRITVPRRSVPYMIHALSAGYALDATVGNRQIGIVVPMFGQDYFVAYSGNLAANDLGACQFFQGAGPVAGLVGASGGIVPLPSGGYLVPVEFPLQVYIASAQAGDVLGPVQIQLREILDDPVSPAFIQRRGRMARPAAVVTA